MKRRSRIIAGTVAGIVLLALAIGWSLRFRVATAMIDRRLAAAHVPASYRTTRIGPWLERMEDVRIGDPARPDLVARRIDVRLGYGLTGPVVRGVAVDGLRLEARLDGAGLHLGALDRLLPASGGGGINLPDVELTAHDAALRLATPNGTIRATLSGQGNVRRRFRGTARVEAGAVRIGQCGIVGSEAALALATDDAAPSASGPARVTGVACPTVRMGAGRIVLAFRTDKAFERVTLRAAPRGFAGTAGPLRFAGLGGAIDANGRFGDLAATMRLRAERLALPDAASRLNGIRATAAGTPIGPTMARATVAAARLLGGARGEIDLSLALHGFAADARLKRLRLTADDGAWVTVAEQGGITWANGAWRFDGDVASGGGALPRLSLAARQKEPGAPLTVTGALDPYREGTAMLALSPLGLRWDGRALRVATRLIADGPIAGGFVEGLSLPINGVVTGAGALTIAPGCTTSGFRALRLASFRFDPARITVCGRPIVARAAGGLLRLDATIAPLRLTGRTDGGAPLVLAAGGARVTAQGFTIDGLAATLGPEGRITRLAVDRLDGKMTAFPAGRFAGLSGVIANVPLDLGDGQGRWSYGRQGLRLIGGLKVSDANPAPRFLPLVADDVALALDGNRITATAMLHEPVTRAAITSVALTHDLASGAGHATLAVPGITFAPKRLQPERLTPLTLGVVANVVGIVTGGGRIDWSARGVTSSGTFATDGLDLAAAFGPVTGIRTRIVFTDLLGLVSAPRQEARIAEVNPGIAVTEGVVHYQLTGASRVRVEDAAWPFAGGALRLDPATLDFGGGLDRRLTFRVQALDAAAFVQQLDFPNVAATGTFDGSLPMVFDQAGGRIEGGGIAARPGGGTLAYVGEISQAQIGTMGKLAFDALKAIRYSSLSIGLDGRLDGEMVSRVRFTGIRQATPDRGLVARLIRNLPFRFNIEIRAPFRGLVGSARSYQNPRLLLDQVKEAPPATVQPSASADRR